MPAGIETAFQKLFPDNTSIHSPDLKTVNSVFKGESENLSNSKRDPPNISSKLL